MWTLAVRQCVEGLVIVVLDILQRLGSEAAELGKCAQFFFSFSAQITPQLVDKRGSSKSPTRLPMFFVASVKFPRSIRKARSGGRRRLPTSPLGMGVLTSRAGDSRCRALAASSNLGEGAYFLAYMEGLFTPRMPTFRASPLVEGPASSARPHSLRRAARRPTGLHVGKRSAENLNWAGGGFTCGWCPRIQGSSCWDGGASLFGTDDPAIPFNSVAQRCIPGFSCSCNCD